MFNRLLPKRRITLTRKVLVEKNNFRRWLVKNMMKKVLDEQVKRNVATAITNLRNEENHRLIKTSLISLPYKGKQGENVIDSVKNLLYEDVEPKCVYTGTKLSAKFQIKEKTKENINMILHIMQNVQNMMKVM